MFVRMKQVKKFLRFWMLGPQVFGADSLASNMRPVGGNLFHIILR
jgi:hypothetical protein